MLVGLLIEIYLNCSIVCKKMASLPKLNCNSRLLSFCSSNNNLRWRTFGASRLNLGLGGFSDKLIAYIYTHSIYIYIYIYTVPSISMSISVLRKILFPSMFTTLNPKP